MIIGIDIDDTLTDIRDKLKEALIQYAKKIGKYNENEEKYIPDNNDGNVIKEKYNLTHDELRVFFNEIHDKITKKAKPREGAKEVIDKLKSDGNKIYIITARDYELHDNPYALSKNWLDKNGIKYDKLIVNARDKSKICKEENIELFIDDQLANCIKLDEQGIKVIRITNYEEKHGTIVNKKNWYEIYDYINIIKNFNNS